MQIPIAAEAAPLDDRMLAMDVADTLRHGIDMPFDPKSGPADEALVERMLALYQQQGLEVPDEVVREGIAAFADGRFAYVPPRGVSTMLARLYVSRRKWQRPAIIVALVLVIGLGGYFFGYRPYVASEAEQAQIELAQTLPAQMDALYQAIFDETKVQTAAADAAELRDRGKDAAQHGDRAGAEQAIADLTALRTKLQEVYTLRVLDKDGVKPGFWTFPPNNSEATNYFIVVEAVDASGNVLSLPVTSEETGATQTVDHWGLRVPETVYDSVMADKQDDGTVEHSLVGFKQDGFTDVDYVVPVLGGAVTQW